MSNYYPENKDSSVAIRYFIGMGMLIGGGYLLLEAIQVTWGYPLYHLGGFNITSGYMLIPFIFGVIMLFYNERNPLGWILAFGSVVALVFGVISSTRFSFRQMSLIELIVILVCCFGGLGLLLSATRLSKVKG